MSPEATAILSAACGVVGFLCGLATALWFGPAVLRPGDYDEPVEAHMDDETPAPRPRGPRGPTPGALVLILLVAAGVIVTFGVQQSIYQEGQKRDAERIADVTACTQEWGRDVITTLEGRTKITKVLEAAVERRNDAVDNVILSVLGLRNSPNLTDEQRSERFGDALLAFADAKTELDTIRDDVRKARNRTPYPQLECSDPD